MSKIIEVDLISVGASAGIILPSELLNKLSLEEGDKIFLVETDEGGFEIKPYSEKFAEASHDAQFEEQMEVAEEGMRLYRNALREWAKS